MKNNSRTEGLYTLFSFRVPHLRAFVALQAKSGITEVLGSLVLESGTAFGL
jgi:hypothetical protein